MAAQKKQKKEAVLQLETDIKKALSAFAAGIESRKLEKKITKHSTDLAELIVKLKQPVKKEKAKPAKAKKAAAKPVKKVIPPVKKK